MSVLTLLLTPSPPVAPCFSCGPRPPPTSLSYGALLPSPWHTAPYPLQAVSTQPTIVLFLEVTSIDQVSVPSPHPSVLGCDVPDSRTSGVAHSLLCLPLIVCYTFLRGIEDPALSWLISLTVRWSFRVRIPLLFHSSLLGVLVPP